MHGLAAQPHAARRLCASRRAAGAAWSTVAYGRQARAWGRSNTMFTAMPTDRPIDSAHRSACPAEPRHRTVPLRRVPCSEQRTPCTRRRGNFQALQWVPCVRTGKLCMRKGMNERLTRRRVMRRTVASLRGACSPLHLARRCMYVRRILPGRIERGVGRSSCLCTYSFAPARGGTPICPPGEAQPIRTYQQWARPSHICTGAGLPHLHRDWRRAAPAAFESKLSARGRE